MFGYRPAEYGVILGPNDLPDASFEVIKLHPNFYEDIRKPVQVSLGCHILGVTPLFPDLNHGPSQLAGMSKRVAAAMPPINQQTLRRFKRFVKRFAEKHLQALIIEPDEDFSFDKWIDNAPYKESRKQMLREVKNRINLDSTINTDIKAHIKLEPYEEPKHLRGIYSRDDEYKVEVGPYFKEFGDRLFSLEWFIKKIPVNKRPEHIMERMQGYVRLFCTDFSKFESTFVRQLLLIERYIYIFSLQKHPLKNKIISLIDKMMNDNTIKFKKFTCKVNAKRMSGEMNTSSGNGLMNLLITFFVLLEAGNSFEDICAFFEGDDGIVKCVNLPTEQQYRDLGANIKIEVPSGINTASFCGNVFDPVPLHNVTNPCEASVRFGWTDPKYLRSTVEVHMKLLQAKSLSMLYSYPGCPILRSLALYGIRVTRSVTVGDKFIINNSSNSYELEQYMEMNEYYKNIDKMDPDNVFNVKIHENTRVLVEELYGIPIDCQLQVENYIDHLTTIQPLNLNLPYPNIWQVNDLEYSVMVNKYNPFINFTKTGYSTPFYMSPGLLMVSHH